MTDRIRRAVDEKGIANVGRGPDHITDPVDPVPVVNIANALTVFRIVLVPVFLVALFVDSGESTLWRSIATVIFAVAALTDRYDGRIARRRGLITDFGKMADPIADKALIGGALVGLSVLGILPWWITAVIVAREVWVTALRFWVLRHKVIPASRGGKLKTLLQAVAIGLYLAPLGGGWQIAAGILMALAVIVTIYTGLDYTWQAVKVRSERHDRDPAAPAPARRAVGGTGGGR
ncbi:CDP-diacylglycerol--glycerol-3-phosphate 3-phosphatidyltransferase [Gordonia jinghuaiqii]|uniref:CDP-diacylglycerol--glycerol-3-phosphate 3-phosphatidyltransferase n=1 Tax=Gordonia jinghuaiqii TaxID=2758710 RepID=A0A7D7LVL2_9ACTN|nr:CDP-diacylglycerol--glycerol-3-phosphate 3-phosphatidyltransferase [Gordonia jinghuaiqii]MCR5976249.1 CDP-diacylglycerol--glycerol-3-phosphate 3-phosphatidyltransferase [Gordonia jinghuaiqii]QMT03477.1 CDP-diacylglycerol--glycerol-3-phosphate 3-phosphatidyltransferase [Gordonia jinghuaiqii]